MVMNQLLVRCDLDCGFAILVSTLAKLIRSAPSTVRRSTTRLAEAGFIEVTHRTGRSSTIRVNFEFAKKHWVAREAEKRARQRGDVTQGAKVSAHTPPKVGRTPRQEVSDIPISSDHRSSYISKRPSGRDDEDAFAQEELETVEADPDVEQCTPLRRRISRRPLSSTRLDGDQELNGDSDIDPFDDPCGELLKLWPKPDADERKLRAAWRNHVQRPGHDPAVVLAAARRWCKYWDDKPGKWVPYAGKWLADKGWEKKPPGVSREDRTTGGYHRLIEDMARKRGVNVD